MFAGGIDIITLASNQTSTWIDYLMDHGVKSMHEPKWDLSQTAVFICNIIDQIHCFCTSNLLHIGHMILVLGPRLDNDAEICRRHHNLCLMKKGISSKLGVAAVVKTRSKIVCARSQHGKRDSAVA